MKTFVDAIFEAEKHSKHAQKFPALSGLDTDNLRMIQEALNPYRVFGIKKFDMPTVYSQVDFSYDPFFNLLDKLHNRDLTGNAARTAITAILGLYTDRTVEALVRVLTKDLKCGASESTFEKLYPHASFPKFELMLAGKIEEKCAAVRKTDVVLTKEILAKKYKLIFPQLAEAKYDGRRLLAICNKAEVQYLTRAGKAITFCNGIFDAELVEIEKYIGEPIVLDGEVLARSFQETSRALGDRTKLGPKGNRAREAQSHLKFYAFDWMTLANWERNSNKDTQYTRSTQVEQFVEVLQLQKILKSKYEIVHSLQGLKNFNAEVLADGIEPDGSLNGRGEGLIIKKLDGLYEWDRSKNWWKWKPVIDVDLKIVGFYAGEAGTKNADKLGGLILEGTDENGTKISTNVGGFKVAGPLLNAYLEDLCELHGIEGDEFEVLNKDQWFRQYVWQNQSEFLGKTAMIEGQELSLASDSDTWAVRFGQFVCIRDDK